ncbi:alpha/beta fold hydrolase [Geothrix alkalitolerans]|uniref:alpha/beta fold hydrolase n=1 Tax=Geothrix alkalitolerans TaxID=2922724 RepID=UPI001FAFD053|nr:alpha/beta hydrolase [Geothrix alkalitolerans]
MRHLTLDGRRIEYREIPAARPGQPDLVLLHEGLGCAALWQDFPGKLAEATGCRVVAGSRAGYGSSDPYLEPRTPRYLHREAEEALPAFLAALGIEHPVLVGHSDGGSIALLFASVFPEAPVGVAVLAPHEFVEEETLAGLRRARKAWTATHWPRKLSRHHADAARVFHEWNDTWLSAAFRDWNIEACLRTIRCPVLAIQGEDDAYATLRQIDVIAEQVPGTRLLKLPRCGHAPHQDQEAQVLAALADFVGGLPRR